MLWSSFFPAILWHICGGQTAVLGFIGSPWTIATYLVEGGSSSTFRVIKSLIYNDPKTLDALLSHLADQLAAFLIYQIESGAQFMQIFDSWGGSLPPDVSPILIFRCSGFTWVDARTSVERSCLKCRFIFIGGCSEHSAIILGYYILMHLLANVACQCVCRYLKDLKNCCTRIAYGHSVVWGISVKKHCR